MRFSTCDDRIMRGPPCLVVFRLQQLKFDTFTDCSLLFTQGRWDKEWEQIINAKLHVHFGQVTLYQHMPGHPILQVLNNQVHVFCREASVIIIPLESYLTYWLEPSRVTKRCKKTLTGQEIRILAR